MKRCPTCQRLYADDTLNFCLEDGASLETTTGSAMHETLVLDPNEPPPTEILPNPIIAPTVRAQTPQTVQQQARRTKNEFEDLAATPPTQQRNTTSVVALTVVATILLLALGGLGAWLLLRDNTNSNTNVANVGTDGGRGGTNSNTLPPNGNVTNTSDGNTNTQPSVTPTPTVTPTPQPTPRETPPNMEAVRMQVSNALNGWRQTMINPDVDAHMSYYASTLHTYYNARNVDVGRVRSNVARAFSTYSTFDVRITNLQIEVDPSGESAIATFDKTFEFTNSEKRYAGSGLNRFWFEKIGSHWLITGEKDLKTYY